MESGFLSKKKWSKLVLMKAESYLNTNSVKKLAAKGRSRLREGTPVTLQHLIVIILYCDFSALCTAFSETFRLEDIFESLVSVKSRHSSFAIFGKLLVELVLEFGKNGRSGESGPFFCGINCVLNIGSFALCLKGPCSTTTVKIVAANFAKTGGMILKLNNNSLSAQYQSCFDCSWISNYFEEAERLWIAGEVPLRIMSILIVQSTKNYSRMLRALYLFDAMISGVLLGGELSATESDVNLLSKLIASTLNGEIDNTPFDMYLKDEWNLFIQRKQEIFLDLYALDNDFELVCDLVMYKVQRNWSAKAVGNENIFRTQWLSIFPALRTVSILTDGKSYKFRLEALKKMVETLPQSVTLMVFDKGHWAKKKVTEKIVSEFGQIGWDIEYNDHLQMRGDANGNTKGLIVKYRE